ncbi:hypothetical protein PK21_gp43 [Geobacillus phage vB_GthS_PK2.1]|nr:hypothetical protein PK21_gp43 [Geobacillus phage vB_GthS_PK2.1]
MFTRKKVETIPFREFMDGNWREKKAERRKESLDEVITRLAAVGTGAHMVIHPIDAHAADMGDIIMKACQPIIDLLQGISYPVAFIMITGGFLLIMTGQTSRGMHFIKWACLGYLGLQFAPALMQIVIQIGQNIQAQVGAVS